MNTKQLLDEAGVKVNIMPFSAHQKITADTLEVYFDRVTGLPVVYRTLTDDPILGDRESLWWLTRWQPAGPVLWPRQWDILVNGQLVQHTVVTSATVDPPPADSLFAIPDSIASRAQPVVTPPPAPAALVVTLNQLAPFVWRAEGSTHHSLIIEQPDQLVVIEAPQSTQRSRAVLDTLRSRFPGKRDWRAGRDALPRACASRSESRKWARAFATRSRRRISPSAPANSSRWRSNSSAIRIRRRSGTSIGETAV